MKIITIALMFFSLTALGQKKPAALSNYTWIQLLGSNYDSKFPFGSKPPQASNKYILNVSNTVRVTEVDEHKTMTIYFDKRKVVSKTDSSITVRVK